MHEWYHRKVALYNHELQCLTYIDSIDKNFEDGNGMPVDVAKDVNITRKMERYPYEEVQNCGVSYGGSRGMYGWEEDEHGWWG